MWIAQSGEGNVLPTKDPVFVCTGACSMVIGHSISDGDNENVCSVAGKELASVVVDFDSDFISSTRERFLFKRHFLFTPKIIVWS